MQHLDKIQVIVHHKGSISYDPDATAYINVLSGITTSQEEAINTFITKLKNDSIYSKIIAFYPCVWNDATNNKWNMVDPRDLDAAFRLTFSGTITHANNAMKSDGSTGWANTHYNPTDESASTSSFGIGFYKKGNDEAGGSDKIHMGCSGSGLLYMGWVNTGAEEGAIIAGSSSEFAPNTAQAQQKGFLFAQCSGNRNATYYSNGVKNTSTTTQSSTFPASTYDLGLLCIKTSSSPQAFSVNAELSCFIVTTGLSDTEATNLSDAILTFLGAVSTANSYTESDAADPYNESNTTGSNWDDDGVGYGSNWTSEADSINGTYSLMGEATQDGWYRRRITFSGFTSGATIELTYNCKSLNSAETAAGNGFVLVSGFTDNSLTDETTEWKTYTYVKTLTGTSFDLKVYPTEGDGGGDVGAKIWIDNIQVRER